MRSTLKDNNKHKGRMLLLIGLALIVIFLCVFNLIL